MKGYYAIFEVTAGDDSIELRTRIPGEYTTEKKAQDVVRSLGGDPRRFVIVWVME